MAVLRCLWVLALLVSAASAASVVAYEAHRSSSSSAQQQQQQQRFRRHAAAAAAAASSSSAAARRAGGGEARGDGFVRAMDFNHQLRVCNAYPLAAPLDVYRGKEESLTGDSPMPYKTCRDFHSSLKAGDRLEFQLGEQSGGSFSISDLPNNDAVLLLVVHRHDTLSSAVAFESHVFADLGQAQVAVIDTYKGKEQATPKIRDSAAFIAMGKKEGEVAQQARRSEELRYNSVVAVSPGVYDVELDGQDGLEKAHSQLVALKHESYVVMRTGVEAQQGTSYPQELVIFPNPDAAQLRSGARRPPLAAAAACGALLAAALAALA